MNGISSGTRTVNVIFILDGQSLGWDVHPNPVHVDKTVTAIQWKLFSIPLGAKFDPKIGIAWNPSVTNPPGTPKQISDTEWILDDLDRIVNGPSQTFRYSITVIDTKGAHKTDDPEVSNDPTG